MEINTEHFLDHARDMLEKRVKVSGGELRMGQYLNRVLVEAEDEAKRLGDEYVSVEHLFMAVISKPNREVKEILRDILLHPEEGLGNPVPLTGALSGLWSREYGIQQQIVYSASNDEVKIYTVGQSIIPVNQILLS